MGIVNPGPPIDLVLKLAQKYQIKDFIETGTYYGKTAVWAAAHFDRVVTIEASKEIYEANRANYGEIGNVDFRFGDSRVVLKEIVPGLDRPALFWLDGHWSGAETFGQDDECPLMEELRIVNESAREHFIMIDDARLFLSPPPLPHAIDQWPSLGEILNALRARTRQPYVVVIQDVIISVPEKAADLLANLCQQINTKEWQENRARLEKTWQQYADTARNRPSNARVALRRFGVRTRLAKALSRLRD